MTAQPRNAINSEIPPTQIEVLLDLFVRPKWLLEGEIYGPFWIVGDSNPESPKPPRKIRFDLVIFDPARPNEICHLTDPQYTILLNTIRLVLYKLRTGKYSRITSAVTQLDIAHKFTDLAQWMILNGIRRFSNLCEEDFTAFTERAVFGSGHLLNYADRLTNYYNCLKAAGKEVPKRKSSYKSPYLNSSELLRASCVDPHAGVTDRAVVYELARIAHAENLYLSPRHCRILNEGPPKLNRRSERQVGHSLIAWFYLWLMRHEPGDHIKFDPFERVSLNELSQSLGRKGGRTKTSPVRQTMELIDYSLRWVLIYGPALLDLRDQFERLLAEGLYDQARYERMRDIIADNPLPEGPASPSALTSSTKSMPSGELSFGVAAQMFVPMACMIVIATFSARRHDEVLSIRAAGPRNKDCIFRDDSGLWIETYIEKTIRDWVLTPCNEVVVASVELLRRWSAPARAASTSVRLFQYKQLLANKVVSFRPARVLQQYVKFLPITQMSDGSSWRFTIHQLRRFFAITYYWRYQYGELASLSYHLRHIDPLITHLYVTEQDSGAIFRHINKEHTMTILTEAALGERNISGPFGERFKRTVRRMLDRFRKTIRVISPELVEQAVERFVKRSGRRLKVFRWGYCACGTEKHQLRTARCLEGTDGELRVAPDLSRSGFSTCGDCPHHATEPIFETFWRGEIEETERAAADVSNPPILRESSRERVSILRVYCERSFENSRPLEGLDGNPHRQSS
jgi:hypothetical protein